MFKTLDDDLLLALEAELEPLTLPSGEVLFRQGEPGDSLYIVVSGRLRVSHSSSGQAPRVISERGRGEVVGEMALLSGEPRSATASASRDTNLARLSKSGLERLTARYPGPIFSAFVRLLADRLRIRMAGIQTRESAPVCVAVMALSDGVPLASFCGRLAQALNSFGAVLHLDSERLDGLFGVAGAAQCELDSRQHASLTDWLNQQEIAHRHVLYQADIQASPWCARCLRQADLILLLARPTDPLDAALARATELFRHRELGRKRKALVLLHQDDGVDPTGTRRWTQALASERHFHLCLAHDRDFARLSRFINRRSVGLALGGGFSRAIGHVGVIRAMRELDIPIDMVGGTSMGAVIAGQCAFLWDWERMVETSCRLSAESMKGDYTLPLVSLMTGRKLSQTILSIAQERDIEDSWLPFFSISASLTRCEMKVHTTGNLAKSIIASARAPGMFPPLAWDDELLVDGGLMNNVPSDVMRILTEGGIVLAVDASPGMAFEAADFGLGHSGWREMSLRINPFIRSRKTLSIIDVLMRTLEFGRTPYAQNQDQADLALTLPLQEFSYSSFARGNEMAEIAAEIAYEYAMERLNEWISAVGRPWQSVAQSS